MNILNTTRSRLLGSAVFIGVMLGAGAATAQEVGEVIVTGSRIRRVETETSAPVTVVDQQNLLDRGFTQVGDALNRLTSVAPMEPGSPGNGAVAGGGQQFPNLFNLGAGRTLTLVNGRRTATSSSGFSTASTANSDRVVDTNVIPTGLIQRVDVVQAGGAAVYGSDAIAGVINYVLRDDFQGVTVDMQYGDSSRGDYKRPSVRVTAGTNFADGRGNIAGNLEYSKTDPLFYGSRPITRPVIRTLSNPRNTSLTDGISAVTPVEDPHFWAFNGNGVLFAGSNTLSITNLLGFNVGAGEQIGGYQFSADGQNIVPYNAGRRYAAGFNCAFPFCSGGEGQSYNGLAALYSGVERYSATGIGHYDLTDRMKLSGELLFARTRGRDPLGLQAPQTPGTFTVTNSNPYLTDSARATLTRLFPAFATGTPIYYGKNFDDLLPTREFAYSTDTYRGVIALDGDFDLGGRNFYYSAFYSRSEVKGRQKSYGVLLNRFSNALNAVRNSAGQIVCAINADAIAANDDPACAPINPFGNGNVSMAGRAYATASTGIEYLNTQDDFLASLGGDAFALPAGAVKFNVSYEHREETAKNTPSAAAQLGLIAGGPVPPTAGGYKTNEFAGELLAPLVGGDFTLPFVQALELTGQYRYVDNSLAGEENVWGLGLRWDVGYGLSLRASRSSNFRAPNLTQLLAPRVTNTGVGVTDVCDPRAQNAGPNPTVRFANCLALFTANPTYGLGNLPTGVANTPENRLRNFFQPSYNSGLNVLTTTGGNPDLRNEISKTTTFGLVWQPRYIPGSLTVTADRVIVDLEDGITPFTSNQFNAACYDSANTPADICSTFTRTSTGEIVTALSTTYNAASVIYRGEVYQVNYRFPVSWFLPMFDDPGSLEINLEATHNENLKTIVAGAMTQQAGTTLAPRWVVRNEVRYRRGPFAASYELYYRAETKVNVFDTIENVPYPIVKENARHSISASYDFMDRYQVRGGINNLTDRGPSFPTFNYGDLIGRQWFVGLRASF